tara:strand:- start:3456 stop:3638 length:183 start_codon:yes stop_codon:yes gene_type:complete
MGLGWCARFIKDEDLKPLIVFAVTEGVFPEFRAEAMEADGLLTKPFDFNGVIEKVRELFD